MALDGSLFNVPDTQAFGRSCNQYGKGAYPQARAVMLTECGSHATVGLHLGDDDEAEMHGASARLPKLQRGMLLMHDANFGWREPIWKRSMPKECVRCSLGPAQSRWSGCAICPMAVT